LVKLITELGFSFALCIYLIYENGKIRKETQRREDERHAIFDKQIDEMTTALAHLAMVIEKRLDK